MARKGKGGGRKARTVSDRLKRLEETPTENLGTSALADSVFGAMPDSRPTVCTVDRRCRTRVFDFPEVVGDDGPLPHLVVHEAGEIRASLACDLIACLEDVGSVHYATDPLLRQEVATLCEQREAGGTTHNPCLVIEQTNTVAPVVLEHCASVPAATLGCGECGVDDETVIVAFRAMEGPWPEAPKDELMVNTILAAVRAVQGACLDVPKHLDRECFLTDDGKLVLGTTIRFGSARLDMPKVLDATALQERGRVLGATIERMAGDLGSEHIRLLVDAMYWDGPNKDDAFKRLHYLRLWQSLDECRNRLGLVQDDELVGGMAGLNHLREYRNDIAHWRTGTIDDNLLVDIYRTINELVRRKYMDGGELQ